MKQVSHLISHCDGKLQTVGDKTSSMFSMLEKWNCCEATALRIFSGLKSGSRLANGIKLYPEHDYRLPGDQTFGLDLLTLRFFK
jgi:hypothetical protein